ncbi:MAG: adenine phosphoribosyltransferase [Dehalococcoidia bacterium]|nr:adenine phosphoribosyltransferase [Dehalococcoidia bacterium]MSQ35406.1 adenine phosphoribosyltransferase [Dehalococcoidia bacterium]
MDLKKWVRDVPDYPKPGILFRDLTPLLAHPPAMRYAVDSLAAHIKARRVDAVCCIDARGFLFGAPVGVKLGLPVIPIRKAGKLPPEVIGVDYALEYGSARIEVKLDALKPGQRVAVVDDLLATGGTAAAAGRLVAQLGATVATYTFVVELAALGGSKLFAPADVFSLVRY